VFKAYKAVRSNRRAAGVDGQTLEFDKDLKHNLYKIWNRMSSGRYFPPPARAVAAFAPDPRLALGLKLRDDASVGHRNIKRDQAR
jgi:hypothetical protein